MFNIKFIITILSLHMITILCQDTTDSHDHFDIGTTDSHDHDHEDTQHIWRAIGITVFAGFASFIGAFSIFCIKKEYIGIMPSSLAFAAGVTIHLTFNSLIPESIEQFNHSTHEKSQALAEFYTLLCVICGILLTLCMETLFHHLGVDPHDHSDHSSTVPHDHSQNSAELNSTLPTTNIESQKGVSAELIKVASRSLETEFSENNPPDNQLTRAPSYGAITGSHKQQKTDYSHVSYKIAFALILHHFPEGIATFVSLVHDFEFGIVVAIALALHDIPSGICISVPAYISTGSIKKSFLLCFIAAIVYPIGAFIGWLIIETTSEEFMDIFIAILFGITAGIMLHISFVELL
eukprot:200579_1